MGVKDKANSAMTIIVVILAAAAILVLTIFTTRYQYEESSLSTSFEGDGSSGTFEGNVRILPDRSAGDRWQITEGILTIGDEEFPIAEKIDTSDASGHRMSLYREDGSFFGFCVVELDMKTVTVYMMDEENINAVDEATVLEMKA